MDPHPLPGWACPLTIAAVAQIGPDDVLLGEAEDPQAATPHGRVQDHVAVSHQLGALVEAHSVGRMGQGGGALGWASALEDGSPPLWDWNP